MRLDLLDAEAAADWPIAQIPSLVQRIGEWVAVNVEARRIHTPPPGTHDRIIAVPKVVFPLSFNVELGAYIGTVRSSLDLLATTLAARHGIGRDDKIYFPIVASRAALMARGHRSREFIEALPAKERAIIESLKPYKGGNETLWTLHQLDIVRKHRRLLAVQITPQIVTLRGGGITFEGAAEAGRLEADKETELGTIRSGEPDCKIEIAPQVLIDEAELLGRPKPAVSVLYEAAHYCKRIIECFRV